MEDESMIDYEKMRIQRTKDDPYGMHDGIELTKLSEGFAEARMAVTPDLINPYNVVHGGALFSIADIAGGAAAASHDVAAVTLDADLHFMRPALNCKTIVARAEEIKFGRRAMVFRLQVMNEVETVLAEGIFTYMTIDKK